MKVVHRNNVTASVESDATGAVDASLHAWLASSSPCEGVLNDAESSAERRTSDYKNDLSDRFDNCKNDTPSCKGKLTKEKTGVAMLDLAGYDLSGMSTLRLRGGAPSPDQAFETPTVNEQGRKRKTQADESPCRMRERLDACFSDIDTNILECRAVIEEMTRITKCGKILPGFLKVSHKNV